MYFLYMQWQYNNNVLTYAAVVQFLCEFSRGVYFIENISMLYVLSMLLILYYSTTLHMPYIFMNLNVFIFDCTHTHVHIHTQMDIYIYIYMCVCV